MVKWLNYHHLYYFRVIAQEGSISQASKTLLLSQSALSTQLKQLETSVGQKLFDREGKKIYLTEAGRVALDYANDIFKKGEEFLQVFNEQSLSARSIYRIGVVASAPKVLATSIMTSAKTFGESSIISMREEAPEELIRKVLTYDLDLIVTNNLSVFDKSELEIKLVGSSSVSIYGSGKYKRLIKRFPNSLNGVNFILPTMHSKLRSDLEHTFRMMGVQYKLIAEVQDSAVKKKMGEEGIGLISLPDFAMKKNNGEKKLFKIGTLENLKEEYWLVAKKRKIKSPITDKLMKSFRIP